MSAAESFNSNGSRPLKTHEVIARQMRDRILRGELAPGQRLAPEDELLGFDDDQRCLTPGEREFVWRTGVEGSGSHQAL